MSWADCTPPAMESVELPDVPAWERNADAGDEQYAYGLDDLPAFDPDEVTDDLLALVGAHH